MSWPGGAGTSDEDRRRENERLDRDHQDALRDQYENFAPVTGPGAGPNAAGGQQETDDWFSSRYTDEKWGDFDRKLQQDWLNEGAALEGALNAPSVAQANQNFAISNASAAGASARGGRSTLGGMAAQHEQGRQSTDAVGSAGAQRAAEAEAKLQEMTAHAERRNQYLMATHDLMNQEAGAASSQLVNDARQNAADEARRRQQKAAEERWMVGMGLKMGGKIGSGIGGVLGDYGALKDRQQQAKESPGTGSDPKLKKNIKLKGHDGGSIGGAAQGLGNRMMQTSERMRGGGTPQRRPERHQFDMSGMGSYVGRAAGGRQRLSGVQYKDKVVEKAPEASPEASPQPSSDVEDKVAADTQGTTGLAADKAEADRLLGSAAASKVINSNEALKTGLRNGTMDQRTALLIIGNSMPNAEGHSVLEVARRIPPGEYSNNSIADVLAKQDEHTSVEEAKFNQAGLAPVYDHNGVFVGTETGTGVRHLPAPEDDGGGIDENGNLEEDIVAPRNVDDEYQEAGRQRLGIDYEPLKEEGAGDAYFRGKALDKRGLQDALRGRDNDALLPLGREERVDPSEQFTDSEADRPVFDDTGDPSKQFLDIQETDPDVPPEYGREDNTIYNGSPHPKLSMRDEIRGMPTVASNESDYQRQLYSDMEKWEADGDWGEEVTGKVPPIGFTHDLDPTHDPYDEGGNEYTPDPDFRNTTPRPTPRQSPPTGSMMGDQRRVAYDDWESDMAMEEMSDIKGYEYEYNDLADKVLGEKVSGERRDGVMADQVEEQNPELVGEENGHKTIKADEGLGKSMASHGAVARKTMDLEDTLDRLEHILASKLGGF